MQVEPEQGGQLQSLLHSQQEAQHKSLHHLPQLNLWTKLRPGVHVSTASLAAHAAPSTALHLLDI